jgi:PhnB protein
MKIASPFVVVDNCKEQIEYYRSVIGGEIKILTNEVKIPLLKLWG